jgi:hypothetical protein
VNVGNIVNVIRKGQSGGESVFDFSGNASELSIRDEGVVGQLENSSIPQGRIRVVSPEHDFDPASIAVRAEAVVRASCRVAMPSPNPSIVSSTWTGLSDAGGLP